MMLNNKTIKLQQWKIHNNMGDFEFVLLVLMNKKKTDFSLGLVCNKPIYIFDRSIFSTVSEDFYRELQKEMLMSGLDEPSAVDLLRSGIVSMIFEKIVDWFFGGALNPLEVRMGKKNEPEGSEYETCETGEPILTVMDVMESLEKSNAGNTVESVDTSDQEDVSCKEDNSSIEQQAESSDESKEIASPVTEESKIEETGCKSSTPEMEPIIRNESEETIVMKTEVVDKSLAIPDGLDKLIDDVSLINRNIRKIVDLQRLGQYTNLQDDLINSLQQKTDELKTLLAKTLLWM